MLIPKNKLKEYLLNYSAMKGDFITCLPTGIP
jgi:hypothetical protein